MSSVMNTADVFLNNMPSIDCARNLKMSSRDAPAAGCNDLSQSDSSLPFIFSG
jgi:hypothetical protein